jgi:hypothetical protein
LEQDVAEFNFHPPRVEPIKDDLLELIEIELCDDKQQEVRILTYLCRFPQTIALVIFN